MEWDTDAVVRAFGRGTAAGDALHKCYVRPAKPSTLDPELQQRLRAMAEARAASERAQVHPKPVPKSRAMIPRPRVGLPQRPTPEDIARYRLEAMPHKKKESVIRREARARSPPKPPQFKRPVMTAAEKERLGQIFQFGEVPEKPVKFTGANRVRYGEIDKRYKLKERFNALKKQVQDLKEELRQLHQEQKADRQNAADDETEPVVIAAGPEIRRRFHKRNPMKALERRLMEQDLTRAIGDALLEMKEIDADICELNANEALKYGLNS
ncbi:hypothetical protein LSM04_007509 [Trypanosoma melophagium]|uniref:uncharacterized protein n=1 Tax=Trypanosoma melophagium TaxID=715481 RepID=UPI00351A2B6D|nr:hypothetical protein LSM04_007509 [Trypanosoma melophagium]